MKNEIIIGSCGTGMSVIGTVIQTNEILQTISLIITIVGALMTYLIVPLYIWFKDAKKDGKITKEEIKEGIEIVKKGKEKINSKKED